MRFFLILISFFMLECSKEEDSKVKSPIPVEWDMTTDWSNSEVSVKDL